MFRTLAFASLLLAGAHAQQAGEEKEETHPSMTWQDCTGGSCKEVEGSVVIDHNWRWVHGLEEITNCYEGNTWDETLCPNNKECAQNCALEGADYEATYGITVEGDTLSLQFVTEGESRNVGSRVYMMEDESTYKMFNLLGNEFTFDVDLSTLPCGLNGALYFVNMEADGGMASYETNKAGAKYGTGYCDAQCARDLKFINGLGNVEGWEPSETDENAGVGSHGACCNEMDVWEANSMGNAFTPHSCTKTGQLMCTDQDCGGTYSENRYAGPCDADGCDFNPYRQGNKEFYGEGMTVDTSAVFTVVTQFLTDDSGTLNEIKRFYVQDGKTIPNSESTVEGVPGNSITDEFCTAQKKVFGDENIWEEKGGFAGMSAGMEEGMVLVMSIWDDHYSNMLWLDATYPEDCTGPGCERGPCGPDSGAPADVEEESADATVIFSNIKFGPINSTFGGTS